VTADRRFPTYEAEERRRQGLPPGVEPVPLHGTGAPALPDHVVDAVAAVLARRMTTPPVNGLGSLRRALAAELERTTTRTVDPEAQILVTNGAMQALGVCFRSLLEPDDEVVVPAPTFFFGGPIRAAGGVPVYVRGTEADGWRWDAEAIERAVGSRTKALLLCNPGNPTGYAPSHDDVAAVVSVAERHGLVIVTDEAYEASLWDGAPFTSAFGLGDDVIVIRSLGKSLSMPQLRLGFLAGAAGRVAACTRTLEWDCLRVNVASQEAARAALEGPRDWLAKIHAATAADRAVAIAAVAATPGLTAATPFAAPFLFIGSPGGELASQLEAVGLPVVDGAAFEGPGYARVPFGGAAEAQVALRNALDHWVELHAAQLHSR
jgi:aspartate aminotransferase